MILDLEESFIIGQDTFFNSSSPTKPSICVSFEDDLNTGYFYATIKAPDREIVDALHIYNVADVINKDKPCTIQIAWTNDGLVASLLINNYCRAIFDFENNGGYCRNASPECNGDWALIKNRELTDDFINTLEGR